MITSLVQMLELPNFIHMTICTIQIESRDLTEYMMSQPLFENIFILRKTGVANFAVIIKFALMLIKTTSKNNKTQKDCQVSIKLQFLSLFSEITKVAYSGETC